MVQDAPPSPAPNLISAILAPYLNLRAQHVPPNGRASLRASSATSGALCRPTPLILLGTLLLGFPAFVVFILFSCVDHLSLGALSDGDHTIGTVGLIIYMLIFLVLFGT